jgi:hypothetical protein
MKVGRNDPCPCESGRKYKHCCLKKEGKYKLRRLPPEEAAPVREALAEKRHRIEAQQKERLTKYGRVRPIVHTRLSDRRVVAVGNEIFVSSEWSTFPDFLIDYAKHLFGIDWMKDEAAKPSPEQHPAIQWYFHVIRVSRKPSSREDGLVEIVPDGILSSYILMLYDLYILRHHSSLQQEVVRRLKHNDQFQGARYELFVAATMIRAGFDIEYEDESDGSTKHPEFVAVHSDTKQRLAVEAKSRHRAGVLGREGEQDDPAGMKLGIRRLIRSALQKDVHDPYVLFLDANLPPEYLEIHGDSWGAEAQAELQKYADRLGADFKLNLAIFTSIPHHYGEPERPRPRESMQITPVNYPEQPIDHPQVLSSIVNGLATYGRVPNAFPEN